MRKVLEGFQELTCVYRQFWGVGNMSMHTDKQSNDACVELVLFIRYFEVEWNHFWMSYITSQVLFSQEIQIGENLVLDNTSVNLMWPGLLSRVLSSGRDWSFPTTNISVNSFQATGRKSTSTLQRQKAKQGPLWTCYLGIILALKSPISS